jgi:hypothetical protein
MKSNTKKLVLAIALFAVAIIVYLKFGREPSNAGVLAEDAKKPDYVCTKCGEHFQPTLEEVQKASLGGGTQQFGEGGGPRVRGGRTAARQVVTLVCPKCGEKTAVAAVRCEQHNVYYPVEKPDGSRGKCPKCP